MYLADTAVVHLVQRTGDDVRHYGSGNVHHVAFAAADLEGTRRALRAAGLAFREAVVPRDGTRQIFVKDPDGVTIELNFAE
jgi:catechol 2,3-dioxygenase-like lactoylglutathione lyase family enzyme